MRHFRPIPIIVVATFAATCKPRVANTSEVASTGKNSGFVSIGAHDFLPNPLRAETIAKAERLSNSLSTSRGVLALAGEPQSTSQDVCKSTLDDVNCYADACAQSLGGNLEDNYMPEGLDPANPQVGEVIKTYWNQHLIEWKQVDGIWQYVFDGKPAARDWPEPGFSPNGPITDSFDLRCDWVQNFNLGACVPGQKRLTIQKGKTTWVFLFRRLGPPQSDAPIGSANHINTWGNIAVLAYRPTDGKTNILPGESSNLNGVCWFNTFNKSQSQRRKTFPIPTPGGRFGTSESEQQRRARIIEFWDTPAQHRTLTASFGDGVSNDEGDNCVTCHGNGPVLDAVWYREKKGRPSGDDDLPFYSVAGLHKPRTFWKVEGQCASCHTYWAKDTFTCRDLTPDYTSASQDSSATGLRRGTLAGEKALAEHVMMMPDPGSSGMLASDYEKNFGQDLKQIAACCNGTSECRSAFFTIKPPMYVGAQNRINPSTLVPTQTVSAPAEAFNIQSQRVACNGSACTFKLTWQDPASRFETGDTYIIGGDGGLESDYCGRPLATRNYLSIAPTDWRRNHEATVDVDCDVMRRVHVCSVGSELVAKSVSFGAEVNLNCP